MKTKMIFFTIALASLLPICSFAADSVKDAEAMIDLGPYGTQSKARFNPYGNGPFINTWLVLGTFDNDAANTGFNKDYISESNVRPVEGVNTTGGTWRYFDDRLFNRSYDNYQDLFSYFKIKREESIAAKVVYAHVYVFSPTSEIVELRIGANNEAKAWVNGSLVIASEESGPYRDTVKTKIELIKGWNSLLLKIANQESGRFGFYARICDSKGDMVPGLVYSPNGGSGKLSISSKSMSDAGTANMPTAFREWSYVQADPVKAVSQDMLGHLMHGPQDMLQASSFVLTAQGGNAPYKWSLVSGKLPAGLTVGTDGTVTGTVSSSAKLGDYKFKVQVKDSAGASATADFSIKLNERPNRWYETDKLVALIHGPECLAEDQLPKFAALMKKEGYGLGMVISYNNGDNKYRWPSMYEPDNPVGDVVGKYKTALEGAGVKFGMYMGNLVAANHGGANGGILMVEEAVKRYHPKAFWFDWLSPDVFGYESIDALYSMIRTISPDTVIVINGKNTLYHGDWDVVCLEGWGAWGKHIWDLWPSETAWPKKSVTESWRLITDPEFSLSKGMKADWQDYMKVAISLIGQGQVANLDHSPTLVSGLNKDKKLLNLDDSPLWKTHVSMAAWSNPAGIPSLTESYTKVDSGPLDAGAYGYNTINLLRNTVYIHMLQNPYGRTGVPSGKPLVLTGLRVKARSIVCMNSNKPLKFKQTGQTLTVNLSGVKVDPVDTILKITLASAHPVVTPKAYSQGPVKIGPPVPAGNLAFYKPARLLSNDGVTELEPSGLAAAKYGVDGDPETVAQGAWQWAWTYQVDLTKVQKLTKIRIIFAPICFATDYKVLVSVDEKNWQEIAHDTQGKGGTVEFAIDNIPTRYIRVTALKPDAEGQVGLQMGIGELQAF